MTIAGRCERILQAITYGENDGADQPATAPQIKSEDKAKPKPEPEVAPR
jgi:hypothetical protein